MRVLMLDLINLMMETLINFVLLVLQPTISSDWVPLTPQSSLPLSSPGFPAPPTVPPPAATCRQRAEQTWLRPPPLSSLPSLQAALALLSALLPRLPQLQPCLLHCPGSPGGLAVPPASQASPRPFSRLSDPARQDRQDRKAQARHDSQQGGQSGGQPRPGG